MQNFITFLMWAAVISLTATFAFAEPPPGKGKNKNWAITAFDESTIVCPGAADDASAAGTIMVGSAIPQCYMYSLAIPSSAPAGVNILEVLTSTFNLAPDAEDTADGFDGVCDDGLCDGVANDPNGACSIFTSRSDSAVKINDGNIPAHQDERIVISVDTGSTGCSVTIYAITDGAQEGAIFDDFGDIIGYNLFLPSSCTPLREHTRYDADGDGDADTEDKLLGIIANDSGLPFVEYVALTTGTRAFRPDTSMIVDGGNRNGAGGFAEFRSLQLQPMGCDTDGDGTPDESDLFPLDPTQ